MFSPRCLIYFLHPVQTFRAIESAISESYKRDVINGDAYSRANWFSYAVGTVGTSIVGTKGLGAVGKTGVATTKSAVQTGIAATKNATSSLANLLPYTPRPQLAMVGDVPFNTLNGVELKNQLISMTKVESVGRGADSRPDFVGKLKGEAVKLPDVKIEKVTFNKRNPNDTAQLRKDFNKVRKDLMKSLANNPEKTKELVKSDISDNDIEDMKEYGLVPDGWQVHHKIPLDQGGTNDVENLVLIKNDPYHKVITNEQNSLTKGMKPGDSKIVDFPIPEGDIYPLNKE